MSDPFKIDYPNGTSFSIDMDKISFLEARKNEIPNVTKTTAAELMRAMEEGYSIAGKIQSMVLLELNRATGAKERRAAEVMLDIAPQILREKGLTKPGSPGGNENQRAAVLAKDDIHNQMKDIVDQLDAFCVLMKIRMRGFEMAFSSVKRAVDTQFQLPTLRPGTADANDFVRREIVNVTPQQYQLPRQTTAKPSNDYGIEIGDANF